MGVVVLLFVCVFVFVLLFVCVFVCVRACARVWCVPSLVFAGMCMCDQHPRSGGPAGVRGPLLMLRGRAPQHKERESARQRGPGVRPSLSQAGRGSIEQRFSGQVAYLQIHVFGRGSDIANILKVCCLIRSIPTETVQKQGRDEAKNAGLTSASTTIQFRLEVWTMLAFMYVVWISFNFARFFGKGLVSDVLFEEHVGVVLVCKGPS